MGQGDLATHAAEPADLRQGSPGLFEQHENAFGAHAKNGLAVSSTKGATGHCFGAAGAVEAVFTTLAVVDKKAPPTINYDERDPDCDLDYVPNVPRDLPDLTVAMSNSFGFGGHNASIVVRAWE